MSFDFPDETVASHPLLRRLEVQSQVSRPQTNHERAPVHSLWATAAQLEAQASPTRRATGRYLPADLQLSAQPKVFRKRQAIRQAATPQNASMSLPSGSMGFGRAWNTAQGVDFRPLADSFGPAPTKLRARRPRDH